MKWFIASDIHGSAYYCEKLAARFEAEGADRLLLLGDILYHGPRNDLPQGYAPKKVMAILNPLKNKIFCVRGNCDSEIDQKTLDFFILSEYALIYDEGLAIYAAHGHKYGPDNPPPMEPGSVLLCGHTHIPAFVECEGFTYVNPGSVSLPKEGSAHGYLILKNRHFTWKSLDGEIIKEISI